MYLDAQSSLTLYKVNLQYGFRLCDLLRDNALRCSEAGSRALDSCAVQLEDAATRMLEASDWSSLGLVSSDLAWKALQLHNAAIQRTAETALDHQAALQRAVQAAVAGWQQDSAAALREARGAMPISTTLQECLDAWLQMCTPATGTPPRGRARQAH